MHSEAVDAVCASVKAWVDAHPEHEQGSMTFGDGTRVLEIAREEAGGRFELDRVASDRAGIPIRVVFLSEAIPGVDLPISEEF